MYVSDPQVNLGHPRMIVLSRTVYGKVNCLEITVLYLSATCAENCFCSDNYVVRPRPITFEMRIEMNVGFHVNFPLLCDIKLGYVETFITVVQCES